MIIFFIVGIVLEFGHVICERFVCVTFNAHNKTKEVVTVRVYNVHVFLFYDEHFL